MNKLYGIRKSEEMMFIALAVIIVVFGILIMRDSMTGMFVGDSTCTEMSDCETIAKTPDTAVDGRGYKIYVAINNDKYERFYLYRQPSYAYFTWVNSINSSRKISQVNLKIKHRETGADLTIEWYNGTSWLQVCDPPNRGSGYIDSCNLSSYINIAEKANNVKLRAKMVKTDNCHVDIDWVELSIIYCMCKQQNCIENWIANYTGCGISDQNLKYYLDENSCGTINDLPGDNGTYEQCDYCSYNIINSSWSEWLNDGGCLTNNSQTQKRSMTEYDVNHDICYALTGLESDLWNNRENKTYYEYRYTECDYCVPNITNSSWSGWYDTAECGENDTIIQQRDMAQYDSNECHETANQTFYETQTIYCDYCVPSLVNSPWTEWYDISECEDDDILQQERSLVQYDSNNCGEADNQTFYETQEVYCDYCAPYLLNTTWSEWYDAGECEDNDILLQEKSLVQYDANYCGEIENQTFTENKEIDCDYCTPNLVNTSWDSWHDITECQADDMLIQEKILTQYDSNNCGEIENQSNKEYGEMGCDYCSYNIIYSDWSSWQDDGGCFVDDTQVQKRSRIEYDKNYESCYLATGLDSDLWNNRENNTYYDYEHVECDYCSEDIQGPFTTECDISNILIQYYADNNYFTCCAITGLESDCHIDDEEYADQIFECDYCVPNLTNTSWTDWENISCLVGDVMNQTRSRTQYDSNYCGEIDDLTITEYRATEVCGDVIPYVNETNQTAEDNETQEDSGEEGDSGDPTPPEKTSSSGGGGGGGGGSYSGYMKCNESWVCSDWLECFNNMSTRDCEDMNLCGTTKQMPNLTKPCEEEYETDMTAQPGHGGSSLKPVILNETDRDEILLRPTNRQTGFIARNLEILKAGPFADYLRILLALAIGTIFFFMMFIERRDTIDMNKFKEQAKNKIGLKMKEPKINFSFLNKEKQNKLLKHNKTLKDEIISRLEKICEENKGPRIK